MFEPIVRGLRRVGFKEDEINYFTLHQEQDIDHGAWLEEAMVQCIASSDDMECLRRGAMASLDARNRFWNAVQAKIEVSMDGATGPEGLDSVAQTWRELRGVKRVVRSRTD